MAVTKTFGLSEFLLAPFRFRSAAQTLQRFIDTVTRDFPIQHLTLLFHRLFDNWMVVNPDRCELGKKELALLGQEIKRKRTTLGEDKVCDLLGFAVLSLIKGLTAFLRLINFRRRFIPHAAENLLPLADLFRGNSRNLVFTDTTRVAFSEIKSASAKTTFLIYPSSYAMRLMLWIKLSERSCNHWFPTPGSHSGFPPDALVPRKRDTVRLFGNCWGHTALLNSFATLSKIVNASYSPTKNH